MRRHYADATALGVRIARDGLPWRHDPVARIAAVPAAIRVIWDLCHFDPPERPEVHAIRCARALGAGASTLAVNEPSMWPLLCKRPRKCGSSPPAPGDLSAPRRVIGVSATEMIAASTADREAGHVWWKVDRVGGLWRR